MAGKVGRQVAPVLRKPLCTNFVVNNLRRPHYYALLLTGLCVFDTMHVG
jgi:hypothetical protein